MNTTSRLTPSIKLSNGESVQLILRRSPIILILLVAGGLLATAFFIAFIIYLTSLPSTANLYLVSDPLGRGAMLLIVGVLYLVILLAGIIKFHLHRSNLLFITNRRLIHQSVTSLFANSLNVIDLSSTEDVSFHQAGLLDHLFRLGSLRISTVGDETTYTFPYVDTPTNEVELISQLISKAKEKSPS